MSQHAVFRGSGRLCAVAIFLSIFAVSLYGQATGQAILGLVTDSSGAVVPGASVTVTNAGTGVESRTTSNETGNYIVNNILVGNYNVACELAGFRSERVTNVRVETNAQVRQNFALQVGDVTETVEVSASGVTLNTENAVVGQVIENKRIIELPLNGRNIVQLAVLVAGVQFGSRTGLADGLGGQVMTGNTYSVSANGQREIHQVVSLDGVDAKDPRVHVAPFVPSIEAIEEFKVQTNAYSAEVGFAGGAVTSITMKSGTNEFHGTLFEFLRNDKLDADNYFNNFQIPTSARRAPKSGRKRNQFGAVASGPIVKNKTFWAANWESRREILTEPREAFFEHDAWRAGNFSEIGDVTPISTGGLRAPVLIFDPTNGQPFANNTIPTSRLHPGVVNNLLPTYYPKAEFRGVDPFDVTVRRNVRRTINPDFYFGRIDHYISDNDRVFGRAAIEDSDARNGNLTLNPQFENTQRTYTYNIASSWVHTFSSAMLNDFRFGLQLNSYENANDRQGEEFDMDSLGIGQFRVFNDGNRKFNALENGIPGLGFGIGDGGEHNNLNTYQFGDHLSWIRGSHNFKVGGEAYLTRIERAAANIPNGAVGFGGSQSGMAFSSLLLGYPNSTTTAEGWPFTFPHSQRIGLYINDNWKATSKLTIDMGFRFDYAGNPYDTQGLWRTLDTPGDPFENGRGAGYTDPATGQKIAAMFPEFVDDRGGVKLWDQEIRFFMPRLGIAYRVTEKLVYRIGAGWFDNISHQNNWTILNLNPPKSGTLQFQSVTDVAQTLQVVGSNGQTYPITTRQFRPGVPILSLNDPFLAQQGGSPAARGAQNILAVPPDFRDGGVWKWSSGFQYELPYELAFKAEYVGSMGTNAGYSSNNRNDARPSPNSDIQSRRPIQRFFDPAVPAFGIQTLANLRYLDSFSNTFHHGMQFTLDKHYSNGLAGGIAYTFSKSHGDGENGGNEGNTSQDPFNYQSSRGRYRFDQTHNFVAHFVWEIPGQNMTGPLKHVLGGWQTNGVLSLRSGFPFTVGQGGDLNLGIGPVRPDRIADGEIDSPNRALWFNPQAFTRVTCNIPTRQDLCRYGNAGYNILESPGQRNLDFSLFKNFQLNERMKLQFRSEFFNASNTPYFGQPNGIGFSSTNVVVPDTARMGEVRSIRTPMRIIQFGLKFFW